VNLRGNLKNVLVIKGRDMKMKINIKLFLISIVCISVLAYIFTFFTKIPYWAAFLLLVAGCIINGIIAEIEDRQRGGFLNPPESLHSKKERKKSLQASEAADLIERFLDKKNRYPQEWNDFIEASQVEKSVVPYRKRCYELDPLVNRPGSPDLAAVDELRRIVAELRTK
jgi:hypothetical protein